MNIEHELAMIHDEYQHYFGSCKLVQSEASGKYLDIVTQEGGRLKVSVSAKGWTNEDVKNPGSQTTYETFELLAMANLKGFQVQFNQVLFSKLELLPLDDN